MSIFIHSILYRWICHTGKKKIEYELLLDVDWLYARTNTTLNTAFHHRLNFSQKRLSPFIRTLQHIGNFWEVKSSAWCPIFTLLMGVLKLQSNLFAQKVIYYPHATNAFWYCFYQKHVMKFFSNSLSWISII